MVALVLAAGLGRRFDMGKRDCRPQEAANGGRKQLTAVDDRGQTLLEYALYDAHLAGVTDVVLVTHPAGQEALHRIGNRIERKMKVRYAVQTPPALYGFSPEHPPLGTGHAFLCGAQGISNPFIVLNADDFYGREAIHRAVACAAGGEYACVAYPAGQTVRGDAVHRGICIGDKERLTGICECTFARDAEGRLYAQDGSCRRFLPEATPVNMNLYALQPAITAVAARFFANHLQSGRDEECLLGDMVTDFIGRTHQIVHILPAESRWYGMTYRRDLPMIRRMIQAKVGRGQYPRDLWA